MSEKHDKSDKHARLPAKTPPPRPVGGAFTWEGFLAGVPAFIFLLNKEGRYTYASRRAFRGAPEDATGKLLEQVLPAAQADVVRSLMHCVVRGQRIATAELSFQDEEGRARRCFVSLSPYMVQGRIDSFSGVSLDTTSTDETVAQISARAVELAERLTPKQREVLVLVAEGLSSREIARRLGVGERTVETHREQLMDRLGIRGVAALARFAIEAGLL
ncbi:MAG: LuxR C-terminal-related transcriptional regulator [Elusimicrobiota bacterium]|nr:MAG: LuxR C-terminal-related transcriptional regulator [Elusimicrobiota bacterium]